MKSKKIFLVILIALTLIALLYWGINYFYNKPLSEEEKYIQAVEYFRKNKEIMFAKRSGFEDSLSSFKIYYYPINPKFRFFSKLYLYDKPIDEWVSKSQGKKILLQKIGYFKINYNGKEYKLETYIFNLFRFRVFFTDLTTGVTTSKFNRFLEFYYHEDKDFVYDVDFNFAYFSERVFYNSASIPLIKENKLDFAVEAGERFKIEE